MGEPKGIFGMDIHRFLRIFVPGAIFILVLFVFFLLFIRGKCTFFYLEYLKDSTVIIGLLIFAYILGVLLEWFSQASLYRFCQRLAYCTIPLLRYEILFREIEVLREIFQECNREEANRLDLNIENRRRLVTRFFDYSYSDNEKNKDHRERIFFKYARIHSIHATIAGIILAYIIGGIWVCYNSGIDLSDLNFWKYILLSSRFWLYILLLSVVPAILYLLYKIARDNLITYEEVFTRGNNRGEVITEMRRLLGNQLNQSDRVRITEYSHR